MKLAKKPAKVIVLFVMISAAVTLGYQAGWVESRVQQPIEFPHKTHLEMGFTCATCHERAEKGAVAGRPPTTLCMGCHAGGDTKSEEIKKLRAYVEKGQEIPWRRVWRLPSHVFFPHRIHVTVAKIQCQTCHGPMESLTKPPARALKKLTMDDCMACHAKSTEAAVAGVKGEAMHEISRRQILNDCNTCHR
jgi:hypothetical protein